MACAGEVERWVLREDRCFEISQFGSGTETELFGENLARTVIRAKGVGLATRAIQRDHQLTVQPFSQAMLGNKSLKLDDESSVHTERQVRVDAIFQRGKPQLLQPRRLNRDEGRVTDVGQRWARQSASASRRPSAKFSGGPVRAALTKRSNRTASTVSGSRSSR